MKKKTIIITGGARGIGLALSEELAQAGHRIVLASRNEEHLRAAAGAIESAGGEALSVPVDVTDRAQVAGMVEQALSAFGAIDVLVNNAGRFESIGPVWETDPDNYWRDITVNLLGPYLCARAVLPHMIDRRTGIIINMIGGGSGHGFPCGSAYGSSKAALTRFSESLAAEVRDHGIAVYATNPGLVRTEMTELQVQTEAGRKWLPKIQELFDQGVDRPPTDAARLVRGLIEGDFSALTGRAFFPDDDLEQVKAETQGIIARDARTLRFRE